LTNLRTLLLYTNAITDLLPLVANTGLGSGDEVNVLNNPLSAISLNTHIPALQSRGVNVSFSASKPGVEEIERDRLQEDWEAGDNIYHKRMEMRQDMIR
jgi:nitrous oxide reductase